MSLGQLAASNFVDYGAAVGAGLSGFQAGQRGAQDAQRAAAQSVVDEQTRKANEMALEKQTQQQATDALTKFYTRVGLDLENKDLLTASYDARIKVGDYAGAQAILLTQKEMESKTINQAIPLIQAGSGLMATAPGTGGYLIKGAVEGLEKIGLFGGDKAVYEITPTGGVSFSNVTNADNMARSQQVWMDKFKATERPTMQLVPATKPEAATAQPVEGVPTVVQQPSERVLTAPTIDASLTSDISTIKEKKKSETEENRANTVKTYSETNKTNSMAAMSEAMRTGQSQSYVQFSVDGSQVTKVVTPGQADAELNRKENLDHKNKLIEMRTQGAVSNTNTMSAIKANSDTKLEDDVVSGKLKRVSAERAETSSDTLKGRVRGGKAYLTPLSQKEADTLQTKLAVAVSLKYLEEKTKAGLFDPKLIANVPFAGDKLYEITSTPEAAAYAAKLGMASDQYRRVITGSQAGFAELLMLKTRLPATSDPSKEIMLKKYAETQKTMAGETQETLKAMQANGFYVDDLVVTAKKAFGGNFQAGEVYGGNLPKRVASQIVGASKREIGAPRATFTDSSGTSIVIPESEKGSPEGRLSGK